MIQSGRDAFLPQKINNHVTHGATAAGRGGGRRGGGGGVSLTGPKGGTPKCISDDTLFSEKSFQQGRTLLNSFHIFQQTFNEKKVAFQNVTCHLQVPLRINEKI